jgi:hypothetical protein
MTPAAAHLIAAVARAGLAMRIDGADLVLSGKPSSLLAERLRAYKAEILEILPTFILAGDDADALLRDAKPPPDARPTQWDEACAGAWVFVASDADKAALAAGWPRDKLFRIPERWARVDRCGVAWLIGDDMVTEITPATIAIETATGATQRFYGKGDSE